MEWMTMKHTPAASNRLKFGAETFLGRGLFFSSINSGEIARVRQKKGLYKRHIQQILA
jgi:hypothetical protein